LKKIIWSGTNPTPEIVSQWEIGKGTLFSKNSKTERNTKGKK
jgi:hypothetical protein